MIKCVIVDDEPLAIVLLRDHVKQIPDLQLLLASSNPLEAMSYMQQNDVDLLFLDIQMQKINGLEFMNIINSKCSIIVTSAYSEYAIHGFEYNIVDYLLKPVTFSRFLTAVSKVKEGLRKMGKSKQTEDYVYLKVEQRLQRVNFGDILYLEGLKDYIKVNLGNTNIVALQTMKAMEEVLPSEQFVRVHKSYVVAVNKIEQIHKFHIVVNNTIIPIGEFYRDAFLKKVLNS